MSGGHTQGFPGVPGFSLEGCAWVHAAGRGRGHSPVHVHCGRRPKRRRQQRCRHRSATSHSHPGPPATSPSLLGTLPDMACPGQKASAAGRGAAGGCPMWCVPHIALSGSAGEGACFCPLKGRRGHAADGVAAHLPRGCCCPTLGHGGGHHWGMLGCTQHSTERHSTAQRGAFG